MRSALAAYVLYIIGTKDLVHYRTSKHLLQKYHSILASSINHTVRYSKNFNWIDRGLV